MLIRVVKYEDDYSMQFEAY